MMALSSDDVNVIKLDQFKCAICLGILLKPVALVCKHLFCESCLDLWVEQHEDCPLCRTTIPEDPNDPGHLTVNFADGDEIIDHVVKSLPPVVQEERRAAKRRREQVVERKEAAAKRRRLDEQSWSETNDVLLEAVVSIALVAVLGSLTWLC